MEQAEYTQGAGGGMFRARRVPSVHFVVYRLNHRDSKKGRELFPI